MVKFSKTWQWDIAEFAWVAGEDDHRWMNFPVSSLGSSPTVGHFRVTAHGTNRYQESFGFPDAGKILLWSITIDAEADPRGGGAFSDLGVARGSLHVPITSWLPPVAGELEFRGIGKDRQDSVSEGMRNAAAGGGGVFVNVAPVGEVSPGFNPYVAVLVRYLVMLPPVAA